MPGTWMWDDASLYVDDYLSRADLMARGWTHGLMRRLLPVAEFSRRSTTSSSHRIPL